MGRDEVLCLRHDAIVIAEFQPRLEEVLPRRQPDLVQTLPRRECPLDQSGVGEGFAAPSRERRFENVRRGLGLRGDDGAAPLDLAFEGDGIDLVVRRDHEPVTGLGLRFDPLFAQSPAQIGDMTLDCLHRPGRRVAFPEVLDETSAGHHRVGIDQEAQE